MDGALTHKGFHSLTFISLHWVHLCSWCISWIECWSFLPGSSCWETVGQKAVQADEKMGPWAVMSTFGGILAPELSPMWLLAVTNMNPWGGISTLNFHVNFDLPFLGCWQKQGEDVCQAVRYVYSAWSSNGSFYVFIIVLESHAQPSLHGMADARPCWLAFGLFIFPLLYCTFDPCSLLLQAPSLPPGPRVLCHKLFQLSQLRPEQRLLTGLWELIDNKTHYEVLELGAFSQLLYYVLGSWRGSRRCPGVSVGHDRPSGLNTGSSFSLQLG